VRPAPGQVFGGFEVVEFVNRGDGFGFVAADIDQPSGDFVAVAVLVGLRAVEEHSAPVAGVPWLRVES